MFTAYVIVAILAATANIYIATLDFARSEWVIGNMTTVGVPRGWLFPLGYLKTAGALGLLVGMGVPLIGVAAATGLVLFYVGAIGSHVRAHVGNMQYPGVFLLLAVGALVLRLASF
jgi:hypothetical protein